MSPVTVEPSANRHLCFRASKDKSRMRSWAEFYNLMFAFLFQMLDYD